jgi:hypothetical protein
MTLGRRCMKNPTAAKTINIATTKPTAARMGSVLKVEMSILDQQSKGIAIDE